MTQTRLFISAANAEADRLFAALKAEFEEEGYPIAVVNIDEALGVKEVSLYTDDEIVVYCTSPECHSSIALYWALIEAGFDNVRRYSGGLTDWEAAGLPLEGDWVSDT